MKFFGFISAMLLSCFGAAFLAQSPDGGNSAGFRLPDVPDTIVSPQDRAAWLAVHYWDNFDFADTSLIAVPEITEQAFVDFISIMPYAPNIREAADTMFARACAERTMLYHFISLTDKYLYEPNSPMCNEDLHIVMSRALVECPEIAEADKIRPRHILEMELKNRPGELAADFSFICRDGEEEFLSGIEADYILLYFNDPQCVDCRRVKGLLSASGIIGGLVSSGKLALLSVCVEGRSPGWEKAVMPAGWIDAYDEGKRLTYECIYDLKAMPTLYLLDGNQRVILKDTTVDKIEVWLADYVR